ncbi:hypothetical protein RINTU1_31530 [Candidatus Regiella insecticola]|uniref:Uncharacterized protein n=1 Tax=Candidatus Regiella insecticola TaxID=138073 RepID=A0A6L2ZRV0_9ENTR|nr:hypothetical protein RINTU1_31530 [Candidatus Regiella insecticola]
MIGSIRLHKVPAKEYFFHYFTRCSGLFYIIGQQVAEYNIGIDGEFHFSLAQPLRAISFMSSIDKTTLPLFFIWRIPNASSMFRPSRAA